MSVHTGGRGGEFQSLLPGPFPSLWSHGLSRRVSQSQVLSQGVPSPRQRGTLVPGKGWGTPVPGRERVPQSCSTSFPGQEWGTLLTRTGLDNAPHTQPGQDWGTFLRQNSRSCTCYAAGDMPLDDPRGLSCLVMFSHVLRSENPFESYIAFAQYKCHARTTRCDRAFGLCTCGLFHSSSGLNSALSICMSSSTLLNALRM